MAGASRRGAKRTFTPLQDELVNLASNVVGPSVAATIVARKIAGAGIRLTREEKARLLELIAKGKAEEFLVTRRKRRDVVVHFTAADGEALAMQAIDRTRQLFTRELKAAPRHARRNLQRLHDRWPAEYSRQWREMVGFRRRLRDRWAKPFSLLRMLMTVYRESGEQIANALIGTTGGGRPLAGRVLIELHARSCQVLYEVITLIEAGLADGAMARCRTLHEIAVTAMFLQQGDDTLTRRYIEHEVVESWKANQKHVRYQDRISERPISPAAREKLRLRYDALIATYGKAFGEQYGWASVALGRDRPSFADIELAVNLDHLRPYYQLASHPVHANAKGLYFKLGSWRRRGQLAIATNHGFASPAASAVVSIVQTLVALMMIVPSVDSIVNVKLVEQLADQVAASFVTTQRRETKRFREYERQARERDRAQ